MLFYVHKPVRGVVGLGSVQTKFRQDSKPLWPDEVRANRVLYPLRFEFDIDLCLPPQRWRDDKVASETLRNFVRAGFQPLDANTARRIVELIAPLEARRIWGPNEEPELRSADKDSSDTTSTSVHEEMKELLVEMGRIQKFVADAEFAIDGGRLDVVWRRVDKSVPTYVFEIQVGGDVYHALAKLKYAFELWNSHVFLICVPEQQAKVNQLLGGSFHELRERLRSIPVATIRELHARKFSYKKLEKELGIP